MPLDPQAYKVARDLGQKGMYFSLARLPQTNEIVVGSWNGKLCWFDMAAEKPTPEEHEGHRGYVLGLARAGDVLLSGAYDGKLIWWDAASREMLHSVEQAHARWIRGIAASPDGRLAASVADDMVCNVWDVAERRLVRALRGHAERTPNNFPSMLYACAFSPHGQHLATADKVGRILVWEVASGNQVAAIEAPTMYTWDPKQRIHSIGGVRSLCFSPDGALLAAGGTGQIGNIDHLEAKTRVEVFDWRSGERRHEFTGNEAKGLAEHLEWAPSGEWLLATGGDHGGFLAFLDLPNNKILREEKAPSHVHDAAFDETGERLYLACHGRLMEWKHGG